MTKLPIVLFHPYVPIAARNRARAQLDSRWLGQGPLVDEFEEAFKSDISYPNAPIAVNSGTSALHLAYILAGIKSGDRVIGPVFTCSATFNGLLYQGATPVFADIERDSLNIDPDHVETLFEDYGERIKAIVAVHYAGFPAQLDRLHTIARKWGVPVIEDAAQAVGARYKGRMIGSISQFTAFSFQAVKTLTTIDGGMLTVDDLLLEDKAKRLRWFGIDRKAKFEDRWKKDIWEIGYKYQMSDVSAALGLEGLAELESIIGHAKELWHEYRAQLTTVPGIRILVPKEENVDPSYWLATFVVDRRDDLKKKLAEHKVESNEVHFRCDRYSVYGGRRYNCPNMDYLEDKYLVLPMHQLLDVGDIQYICDIIKRGW